MAQSIALSWIVAFELLALCVEMKKEVSLLELKLEEKRRKLQTLIAQVHSFSHREVQSKQKQGEKQPQQNISFCSPLPDELSPSLDTPSVHEESEPSFHSISVPEFTYSDLPSLGEPENCLLNDDFAIFT